MPSLLRGRSSVVADVAPGGTAAAAGAVAGEAGGVNAIVLSASSKSERAVQGHGLGKAAGGNGGMRGPITGPNQNQ